ncbi:MAG: hypothetical protein JKY54_10950 [Flavobacteriales bacterium]|nr:hypothetical protein [Flavobacteriales bacterium]
MSTFRHAQTASNTAKAHQSTASDQREDIPASAAHPPEGTSTPARSEETSAAPPRTHRTATTTSPPRLRSRKAQNGGDTSGSAHH